MTNEPEIFTLSTEDKQSALWWRLKKHFEQKLDDARKKNDAPLDPDETADIRGQIKVYKTLLRLDDEGPVPTSH